MAIRVFPELKVVVSQWIGSNWNDSVFQGVGAGLYASIQVFGGLPCSGQLQAK